MSFSQRGSAIINALVVSLVIGGTSALILRQAEITEKSTRYPRIRQLMNNVEIRMRTLSLSPSAYLCTDPNVRNTSTCSIRTSLFEEFNTTIAGADCPGGGTCGIRVLDQRLESGASTVNAAQQSLWYVARLEYFGEEIGLRPREVRFEVPFEVLQADVIQCPAAMPIFAGFDARGDMICRPLSLDCPPGHYMSQVNPNNLQGTCVSLGAPVSAPGGQMISGVSWSGGVITPAMAARKAPLSYFNYTPIFNTEIANSYGPISPGGSLGTVQVGGPPPADVMCGVAPITTTTISPTTTVPSAGPTTTAPSVATTTTLPVTTTTLPVTTTTLPVTTTTTFSGACYGYQGGSSGGESSCQEVPDPSIVGCLDSSWNFVPVGGMFWGSGMGVCGGMPYETGSEAPLCRCYCDAPGVVNCSY